MSKKNVNKKEIKHKATHKGIQHNARKLIYVQIFVLIITHIQMSHKNVRKFCFIQFVPFC